MKTLLGFLTLAALLIAYSAAKNFWSGPLENLIKQDANAAEPDGNIIMKTPVPTPTPTSTTSTTTSTTTLGPCANGCIPPTVGTANAPTAPPPFNTNYNGRNPLITSYPTTQP